MASQLSGCSSQRLVLTIMSCRGDETSLETRQPSLFRHLRKTQYGSLICLFFFFVFYAPFHNATKSRKAPVGVTCGTSSKQVTRD